MNQPLRLFASVHMRKYKEKQEKSKKYKLKTKKAFQKRFQISGPLRNRRFTYQAKGYQHRMRNHSNRNLRTKGGYYLTNIADIKKAKKMMPYYKRRKSLSV